MVTSSSTLQRQFGIARGRRKANCSFGWLCSTGFVRPIEKSSTDSRLPPQHVSSVSKKKIPRSTSLPSVFSQERCGTSVAHTWGLIFRFLHRTVISAPGGQRRGEGSPRRRSNGLMGWLVLSVMEFGRTAMHGASATPRNNTLWYGWPRASSMNSG